ncbi:MAG: hypothetical protein DMG88_20655 [Acidobacteria bacterium]|nr:MAG: hypothetical protein DMG88_20655 [Acidobacteriota bacterium]
MLVSPILSRFRGYYQRKAASLVFRRPFVISPTRPLISFTFDDFPRSALLAGGAILNRFGVAGNYYVSLGLLNKNEPSEKMFILDDLTMVLKQGHELGCHTFSHRHSWETDRRAFEESILQNRTALGKLVAGAQFRTFSYPICPPRPLTKAAIAKYFLCCRGGGQTLNVGPTDLNQLSAFFLEKSRHDIQAVKDLVDHNRRVRGWLILATHDVCETPTPFGCTPEFFEDIVQCAVNSGAQILPVASALEVLGAHASSATTQPKRLASRGGTPRAHTSGNFVDSDRHSKRAMFIGRLRAKSLRCTAD